MIGDRQADGGWAVRSYIKPFANWIWLGCIMMAIGGLISLSIGATGWLPARARRPPTLYPPNEARICDPVCAADASVGTGGAAR
nr:cytochrome c-type biogenesis CcmF C-terminal domain-containing protein [Paracoccus tegillarcae]